MQLWHRILFGLSERKHLVLWPISRRLMCRGVKSLQPITLLQMDFLQDIWELEPVDPSNPDAWQPMRYTDGRPTLGVLSTNSVWWRYYTTPTTNLVLVQAVSRLLVCDDILTRTVVDPPNVQATEGNQEDLIKNEPALRCLSSNIGSVGSIIVWVLANDMHDVIELSIYHPEREWDGERDLENTMGWYGKPLRAPADLGAKIAEDAIFNAAAERLAERLWRREVHP